MPILELLNSLAHNVPHTPYIILFTLGFIVLIKLLLPPRNKPATIAFTKAPTATNAERVTGLLIGTAVGDAKVRLISLPDARVTALCCARLAPSMLRYRTLHRLTLARALPSSA